MVPLGLGGGDAMSQTLAQQKLQSLASDRIGQYDSIIAALGEDSEFSAEITAARLAVGGSKDALGPYVESVGASILAAVRSRISSPATMSADHVVYGSTALHEAATAQALRFEDGSGLVLASDAMLSMCVLLGGLTAGYWARNGLGKPWPRTIWRLLKAARDNAAIDPLTTASLRFYLVQQRVFGIAAKRFPPLTGRSENTAALLGHLATVFVLAHETAHFSLGHVQNDSTASGDPANELAADALALEILDTVVSMENIPRSQSLAVAGAVIGLLATDVAERAIFVRSAHTHPQAATRLDALARLRPANMKGIEAAMSVLVSSARQAGDIGQPVPEIWWRELHRMEHPQFVTGWDADPIRSTAAFDQLCGQSRKEYQRILLEEAGPLHAGFAEALEYLGENKVLSALRALGAKDWQLATISPASNALSFQWLLQIVIAVAAMRNIDESRRRVLAVALARYIEITIQRAEHG